MNYELRTDSSEGSGQAAGHQQKRQINFLPTVVIDCVNGYRHFRYLIITLTDVSR